MCTGASLFILDLDVGFIHSPGELVAYANTHKAHTDILVQYDWGFVMDRTPAKWKTWYVEALANIGLFYCRGNSRTVEMFKHAWKDYMVCV